MIFCCPISVFQEHEAIDHSFEQQQKQDACLRNTLDARCYKGDILIIAGRIHMVTGDILNDQGDQCCDRRLAIIADNE